MDPSAEACGLMLQGHQADKIGISCPNVKYFTLVLCMHQLLQKMLDAKLESEVQSLQ